jgi:hypothetical protein
MIRIDNDFVFRFCDKITDLPYGPYYINNFEFGRLISKFFKFVIYGFALIAFYMVNLDSEFLFFGGVDICIKMKIWIEII